MPFYEYECSNCRYYVEVMQKISDKPLKKCPSCGKNTLQEADLGAGVSPQGLGLVRDRLQVRPGEQAQSGRRRQGRTRRDQEREPRPRPRTARATARPRAKRRQSRGQGRRQERRQGDGKSDAKGGKSAAKGESAAPAAGTQGAGSARTRETLPPAARHGKSAAPSAPARPSARPAKRRRGR